MSPSVVAGTYVLIAVVAANIVCKMVFPNQKDVINRASMGWALLNFMLFLTPSVPLYFIGAGLGLMIIAPRQVDDRFQFYIAILPVITMDARWQISLPGIETLMILDHVKMISIALLISIYFRKSPRQSRLGPSDPIEPKSKASFRMFMTLMIIVLILGWRESNITSIFRNFLEQYLNHILLVLVVFKLCRTREIIDKILFACVISGVFLAIISCIEVIKRWDLYSSINPDFILIALKYGGAFRGSIMRTPVTMGELPFSIFMAVCVILSIYFLGLKKKGNTTYGGSLIITGLLAAGLFFSGSRGALASLMLMIGLMLIMSKAFKPLRLIAVITTVIALFSLPQIIKYVASLDPYGTFQYRVDLFSNSIVTIKDSFFLGSLSFREHPAMQSSIQGQGIIDVVNVYISFALLYGVPVLVLFLLILMSVFKNLAKLRKWAENTEKMELIEWQARTMIAVIAGQLMMIFNVSLIDRVSHYLWISIVLGICVYRYGFSVQRIELGKKTAQLYASRRSKGARSGV